MLQLKHNINGPCVVCGDFIVTRYPKRINYHRLTGAMSEFSSYIEEMKWLIFLFVEAFSLGKRERIIFVLLELKDFYIVQSGERILHI